ncbi:hypothetical protein F5Y08DRAFT_262570 [Xylaria arbuscula]|nr:hypothetical protein F5Y08DRAFT_262570 [Xylaria arbuscula]
MLRRPPTTLSLTAEDIAAYEDRRYEQHQLQLQAEAQAQAQAHAHLQPRSQPAHALMSRNARARHSMMDTSTSSPNDSTDEAMEDVAASGPGHDTFNDDEDEEEEEEEEEEDDDDDDDPFSARGDMRAAGGGGRATSPGAQRSAYLRQMRARGGGHGRSQSHTHATSIPTSTSTYTSVAASRSQRIMGSASASALPSAAAAASAQASQVPAHLQQTPVQNTTQSGTITTRAGAGRAGRQASEPPPAPTRVTRSRDERIGIAPGARPADMGPGGAAGPTMRRR